MPFRGYQDDGEGGCIELRNCRFCGTTLGLARDMPPPFATKRKRDAEFAPSE